MSHLVAILGQQGCGKTTLAMFLARYMMRFDKSIHLYTNVNVTGDNVHVINDFSQINLDPEQRKIVIVDESMFTVDSRNANSKQNKNFSKILALFRKSSVLYAFFCTHTFSMVDNRLRDQFKLIFFGRKHKSEFQYLCIDAESQQYKPLYIKKSNEFFDFCDFNTRDFPLPISSEGLEKLDLFKI